MKKNNIEILHNINIPLYHINNFKMKHFKKFPLLTSNNGSPYISINMYLQSPEIIKLSELSILKIGYALSLLLKFCESKNIELKSFNNSIMFEFAHELSNEISLKKVGEKARKNNSTNFILKTSLSFFDFLGKNLLNNSDFCKLNINAEIKKHSVKLEDKGTIEHSGWYHASFKKKENVKRRSPISMGDIKKLYDVIPKISESKYVQHRIKVILRLLEITGARAGEIAKLTVTDIENAFNSEKPLLKIITLKRRDNNEYRFVPVDKLDLKEINTFIKIYRAKIIKNTIGQTKDHGYLLINEKNGSPILSATISNEIIKLRNLASISSKACAHMFRHRYITNLFVKLIKQYDLENQDDFRNALLDINSLKVHIQQATGHKDLSSLDHYIDLAKAELTNIDNVLDKVNKTNHIEAIDREKERLLQSLKNKEISAEDYINAIESLKT